MARNNDKSLYKHGSGNALEKELGPFDSIPATVGLEYWLRKQCIAGHL
jgi:hypothetical protein